MPTTDPADDELLHAFRERRSEQAFNEIVARHAKWVFAVAYRRLRDKQLAEDATQAVFLLLYTKGPAMSPKGRLSGWLFNSARYVSSSIARAKARRAKHETRAANLRAECAPEAFETPADFSDQLDAAVARLSSADRAVVLLRFYENRDFDQIALAMGTTESAARKRLTRAVEKLRGVLGSAATTEALTASFAVGFSIAPHDLPDLISRSVQASAPVVSGTASLSSTLGLTAKGGLLLMALSQSKMIVTGLVAILLAGGLTGYFLIEKVGAPNAVAAADPPTASVEHDRALAEFLRVYALADGEVFKHVPAPFPAARSDFYISGDPQQAQATGQVPTAMLLYWREGKLHLGPRTFSGGVKVVDLVGSTTGYYRQQTEGDPALVNAVVTGDFVFRQGTSEEQTLAALSTVISSALGKPVHFAVREVRRPVVVLSGTWKYAPADQYAGERYGPKPTIEFYGADLNTEVDMGNPDSGDIDTLAKNLGWFVKEQVLVEASGLPQEFQWHINARGNGSEESRRQASDLNLVMKHIEEQTGLHWSRETRTVRRLFITRPDATAKSAQN